MKRPVLETIQKIWWHGTASIRPLPDFLIGGIAKGGTEALWDALIQHPEIATAHRHSLHYFDEVYYQPLRWYRAHFPIRLPLFGKKVLGEKSTFYLSHPYAAKRMAKDIPNIKLVFILRNPVDRAISQYFHYKQRGYETLGIMEAMQQEEERLQPHFDQMTPESNYPAGHPMKIYSYKVRGHYAEQLKTFYEYFDKDQIKLIKSEEFFSNPDIVLKDLFEFLGIDPSIKININGPVNQGKHRKDDIPQEVRDYLEGYYKPYNEELRLLCGNKFTW